MTHAPPLGEQDIPAAIESSSAPPSGKPALLVGAGILASRLAGFVRQRAFAHYFGAGDAADAFTVAFRIPNLLQNLLGEGVLSASFIPVYAGLRREQADAARREVASAVLSLLALVCSLGVAVGMLAAPALVDLIAGGFTGTKRDLTITLVRILFPGAALLVWSAWCLGVLNSHGRFFLSYAAPVAWNATMVAVLLAMAPGRSSAALAVALAWGSVIGSALVFGVQLPAALRLLHGLRATLGIRSQHVRQVVRNFVPVLLGRGVVQLSAYVDIAIASFVAAGAAATLGYAQMIYLLPVSLFGMSVSAAELPIMAAEGREVDSAAGRVRTRLTVGLRRIAFFVVPSAVAMLAFGDLMAAILYQSGRFGAAESVWVWRALGGAALGLVPATAARLYASAFYALQDTRTPVRFALGRVLLSLTLGILLALVLPRTLALDLRWGVAGLTAASGVAAWLEFVLLRRSLAHRVGATRAEAMLRLWLAAGVAALIAWLLRLGLGAGHAEAQPLAALVILSIYGVAYVAITWRLGSPESSAIVRRLTRLR
ncbi:MAG: murein biosynthesis integral membrane protein MurJ [Gemmatimonadaceae bacterium]